MIFEPGHGENARADRLAIHLEIEGLDLTEDSESERHRAAQVTLDTEQFVSFGVDPELAVEIAEDARSPAGRLQAAGARREFKAEGGAIDEHLHCGRSECEAGCKILQVERRIFVGFGGRWGGGPFLPFRQGAPHAASVLMEDLAQFLLARADLTGSTATLDLQLLPVGE